MLSRIEPADVDPFIGSLATDLPEPEGVAATWWSPKPQVGNTHPGAAFPFGMVSACAYSGAYPTGYGLYDLNTEGRPSQMFDTLEASGFTHFQQSGTGAIRKYYNYFRVTPMLTSLDDLGSTWALRDEQASPGYYAATLDTGSGAIRAEITVGPKSAVHRYTFPESRDARIVIDCSMGGLDIEHGATVPLRAALGVPGPEAAHAEIVMEGAPLAAHVECDAADWRPTLWYDRRLMPGSTRLDFDHIRPTTLRPFGLIWRGPTTAAQTIEIRIGFSLRGVEQAEQNLRANCGTATSVFERRRSATEQSWREQLGTISVDSESSNRTTTFATALYHSMLKPAFAPGESPFWPASGPFVFDIATMWDIYRTQLPLMTTLFPERAVELAHALLTICEEEGNLPIGYRMARGADRFARQGSGLAHTFLADICQLDAAQLSPVTAGASHGPIDWEWALANMHSDLRRGFAEDFLERGIAHPISHTLDVAFAYRCTAIVAHHVGDVALAGQFDALAEGWLDAYDPETGLLLDSTFYEGGKWNYSFRLLHDMATRIALAGGENVFVEHLDQFFGFGAEPVKLPGQDPGKGELDAGALLNRFEGLNNEPDMEVPWAYSYAGRPDRTADVVHAVRENQFGIGRGGLPGNDDSGGLSSWLVWATLGLFPVAGQHLFIVHPPAFRSSELKVPGGVLRVDTHGFVPPNRSAPSQYIEAIEYDGVRLDRIWLSGTEVHGGGHLVLTLGDDPSTCRNLRPPPSSGDSSPPSTTHRT